MYIHIYNIYIIYILYIYIYMYTYICINIDKELLNYRLIKREDFWTIKLKTLQPHEFNTELNSPNP